MPKVISDEERELTKQALHRAGVSLIKSKKLRNVTVDDITKTAGIAKGSFYSHYGSKEELLYEVLQNSANKLFKAVLDFRFDDGDFKRNIEKALNDIYLAPDSIALYMQPEDIEYIRRKFPDAIQEAENERVNGNLSQISDFFGLSETDAGTLAYLMDGFQYIASCASDYGRASHRQSLDICVRTIAEFISEKSTKKGV